MNINPLIEEIPALKEAFNQLPQPYKPIDDDFLKDYAEPLNAMKEQFANKGGLHVLEAGENRSIICRVPSKSLLDEGLQRSKKQKQIDVMQYIVGTCCLYPSFDVVNKWVSEGASGLFIPLGNKLMELAGLTQETTAKKL